MTEILSPAVVLGAILSTAYATLFHLWQKGDVRALRHFLLVAWLGFAGGHILGDTVGVDWLRVGQLCAFCGTAGAVAALFVAKSLKE